MRLLVCGLICAALLCGGKLKEPPGHYESDRLEIESKIYTDREDVKRLLGSDFDGGVVVVELTITPKGEEPLDIRRDNFQLFSNRDAQRSQPFHPSQLAGKGALVVGQRRSTGGTYVQDNPNPAYGGLGFPGSGTGIGNSGGDVMENTAKMSKDAKADPVLATLQAKVLQETKTTQPVSGLLYFGMDGKQKPKDLELFYRGPAGKFAVQYRP